MTRVAWFCLALVALGAANARAELIPQFPLDQDALRSTHAVIASVTDATRGEVVVLESLRGDLAVGARITVPFLARFADAKEKAVVWHRPWGDPQSSNKRPDDVASVSGGRLALFLKKNGASWSPANPWNSNAPSVVFFESGKAFGPYSGAGQESVGLFAMGTERDVLEHMTRVLDSAKGFDAVVAIKDIDERVKALDRFLEAENWSVVERAFRELEKCGKAALPIIRATLANDSRPKTHFVMAHRLIDLLGSEATQELTVQLRRELAWVKSEEFGRTSRETRQFRHVTVIVILDHLRKEKAKESLALVEEFRDYLKAKDPYRENVTPNLASKCQDMIDACK